MSFNLAKTPFIRTLATKGTAGQFAPVGGKLDYQVNNSSINKTTVISAENDSPISRVSIVLRAGARNEDSTNLGVAHVLRICAGLSTKNASQFAITRHIQQVGASLHCTSDRETISYTLEGTRAAIEQVLPYLTEVVTQQVFKPWEVSDNANRIRLELASRPPQLRTVDLLHKAAFRTGLGNSLFIAKHQLGKISTETLQHYVNSNFSRNRCAVVGLGVDHKDLETYVGSLEMEPHCGDPAPSAYKGGEIRCDKGGNIAYVAIAAEGAALKNAKEAVSFAVLQKVLGVGPQVRWGASDNGLLRSGMNICGNSAISALNVSYGDTGLFGVIFATPSESAGVLTTKVMKILKSSSVDDADVQRGKNQLKTSVLLASESGRSVVRKLGTSGVLTGCGVSPIDYFCSIDKVTTADVNAALSKVSKSKLTIASFGNLSCVPYRDDLK